MNNSFSYYVSCSYWSCFFWHQKRSFLLIYIWTLSSLTCWKQKYVLFFWVTFTFVYFSKIWTTPFSFFGYSFEDDTYAIEIEDYIPHNFTGKTSLKKYCEDDYSHCTKKFYENCILNERRSIVKLKYLTAIFSKLGKKQKCSNENLSRRIQNSNLGKMLVTLPYLRKNMTKYVPINFIWFLKFPKNFWFFFWNFQTYWFTIFCNLFVTIIIHCWNTVLFFRVFGLPVTCHFTGRNQCNIHDISNYF